MRTRSETALPELESRIASTRPLHSIAKPGLRRRFVDHRAGRIAAAAAACLAFGGTAMAATGIWSPGIGSDTHAGPAAISDTPVPGDLAQALGVLRRAPDARDRSPQVKATLVKAKRGDGARPDSIRYLGSGPDGRAVVLFSAQKPETFEHGAEPACVAGPSFVGNEIETDCFSPGEVLSGRGLVEETGPRRGGGILGLVPDGVATVTIEFNGAAPPVMVAVTNNYWSTPMSSAQFTNPHGEDGVHTTVWRDADGSVVPQQSAP